MKSNNEKQKFVIAIRIRPFIEQDRYSYKGPELQSILNVDNQSTLTIQRKNSQEKTFRFNHIFQNETQDHVYEKSKHLVQSIFQGHNSTFLAYGQTGTGKTHTIFGSKGTESVTNSKGYFHRAVSHIFATIKQKMHSKQFAVRVSFIQFYMDNIFDLIENNGAKLEIKQTADDGIHIKDAAEVPVKSADQLFSCVKAAIMNRKTQQTSIVISLINRIKGHQEVMQLFKYRFYKDGMIRGMLKIVDLAGSQRVSKTQSFGPRLEEAKRINKEITTLGKCINLLAQNQKQNRSSLNTKFNFTKAHIPFRDSKITRYLTDTLQGRAKIMLCVCVSPYTIHLEETFSSLMFATQASTLKVESKRNEVYSITKQVQKTPKKYTETPVRSKAETKLSLSNETQLIREKQKKDDGAVSRIMQEIQEIEDYLFEKRLNPSKQSKQNLQNNLIAYQKIFSILRKRSDKETSRRTSSIHYN